VAAPVEAGVVLKQPTVKNFVRDDPVAAAAKSAAPGEKKAAPAKRESSGESSSVGVGAFEAVRPLVLPLSVLAVAGAGVAASKADPKFAELFSGEWSAKDNNVLGLGYETAPGLKDTPFYGGSNSNGAVPKVRASDKCFSCCQPLESEAFERDLLAQAVDQARNGAPAPCPSCRRPPPSASLARRR
jgi:hypothetical protein